MKGRKPVAGVVLAAGASQRMGRRKALLRFNGLTFLENLVSSLRDGGCQPVFAVVAEPLNEIRESCQLSGVNLVVNPNPQRGQISSLRCALQAVGEEVSGAVVLLVDQGTVHPEAVRAVRVALSDVKIAIASYRGNPGHPTGFSKEIFVDLFKESADEGARSIVEEQKKSGSFRLVDVDDPSVVRNINTPADYELFLSEKTRVKNP